MYLALPAQRGEQVLQPLQGYDVMINSRDLHEESTRSGRDLYVLHLALQGRRQAESVGADVRQAVLAVTLINSRELLKESIAGILTSN